VFSRPGLDGTGPGLDGTGLDDPALHGTALDDPALRSSGRLGTGSTGVDTSQSRPAICLPPLSIRLGANDAVAVTARLTGVTTNDQVHTLIKAVAGPDPNQSPLVVRIDGIESYSDDPLWRSGLRHGSLVTVSRSGAPITDNPGRHGVEPQAATPSAVVVTWVTGPDAGRSVALPAGRWIIGRSPAADIGADDPHLAMHQGILSVDTDDTVTCTATYTDLRIGRPALLGTELVDGPVVVRPHVPLVLGASTVLIAPAAQNRATTSSGESSPDTFRLPVGPGPATPWKERFHRPPRELPGYIVKAVQPPEVDSHERTFAGGVGIVSAITSLAGGVAIALIFRQLLMIVIVGVGAAGLLITSLWQAIRRRRRQGRSSKRAAAELNRFSDALRQHRDETERCERAAGIDLSTALTRGRGERRMWQVRPGDTDAFSVALGTGDRLFQPRLTDPSTTPSDAATEPLRLYSTLRNVPIRMTLSAAGVVGVCGANHVAVALVRSMICQLAVASGPADWMLIVLADPPVTYTGHVGHDARRQQQIAAFDRWDWASWLPQHCADVLSADDLGPICQAAANVGRRVVVITGQPTNLSTRTSPLRRAMNMPGANLCVIVIAEDVTALPALCTDIIHANLDGTASWQTTASPGGGIQRFRIVGASTAAATSLATTLARFDDPEMTDSAAGQLAEVDLLTLLGGRAESPRSIAEAWRSGGPDIAPIATIGRTASGTVDIDLVGDGPHGLIAGTTGAGKSELLRTIVLGLAVQAPPEQLSFVLIDYKGGAAFDQCARLPHVVGMVSDLDEHLASRVLRSLDAEIRRREHLLRATGAVDLGMYRRCSTAAQYGGGTPGTDRTDRTDRTERTERTERPPADPAPAGRAPTPPPADLSRLVIVVDEFASMASELPGFLSSLVSVAQRGRSLGMHLLLATQRPAGVVSDEIKANTNIRIALRVHHAVDSTDVIGDPLAATLPRRSPGRAVIRLGVDELEIFQTASCTGAAPSGTGCQLAVHAGGRTTFPPVIGEDRAGPDGEDRAGPDGEDRAGPDGDRRPPGDRQRTLDVLIERISLATVQHGREPPHRPWLDPLPERLPRSELTGAAIGLVDRPDEQRRDDLTWNADDGHLVIAGSIGSGTTTTLLTVGLHAAEQSDPCELHIYVIDASGGSQLDVLDGLAHCSGVVRATEHERRARLLDRLRRLVIGRATGGRPPAEPRVLLLIDGLLALRSQLIEASRSDELVDLERIIADGPGAGIAVAATVEQAGAVPASLMSRLSMRWVMRLTDAREATGLGVPHDCWPARMSPGRGVIGGSGAEFQVAIDTQPLAEVVAAINRRHHARRGGPSPIGILPPELRLAELLVSAGRDAPGQGAGEWLVFGRRSEDLGLAALHLYDGEHALVGGPPRSGRTTALATLAMSWRARHDAAWLGIVAPRSAGVFDDLRPALSGSAEIVATAALALPPEQPALLVVDDCALVDDPTGRLSELLTAHRPGLHIIIGGQPESVRSHSHWAAPVRRSRKGLLLGALNEIDGDTLGVFLPRRAAGAAIHPGRGYLISDGKAGLVQVARDTD
jgi:DNA segregation ATPase FtsK/SpoIIIE, S-DNA-T family